MSSKGWSKVEDKIAVAKLEERRDLIFVMALNLVLNVIYNLIFVIALNLVLNIIYNLSFITMPCDEMIITSYADP